SEIAFAAARSYGQPPYVDVDAVNVTTGAVRMIARGFDYPTWSSDARAILALKPWTRSNRRKGGDAMRRLIVLVRLAMTTLGLAAIAGPAEATFPGSNGRIAFITVDQGCCEIATMEPDGSDVRQLTHVGPSYGAFDPSWSPDGAHLVFSRQRVDGK